MRFVRDFEFWTVKIVSVIHESACVVNASSMRDYARDTRRPSVLMRRNWFETAHVHVRPLTPHFYITHEPRAYHVYRGTKLLINTWNVREACVFGRAPSVIHALCVRRMFVEYCTVFARMRRRARYFSDSSVTVHDTCAVHAWFMRDSSVISTPDTPTFFQFSTHKHTQTQSVRDLWVIRKWSAVWLVLKATYRTPIEI